MSCVELTMFVGGLGGALAGAILGYQRFASSGLCGTLFGALAAGVSAPVGFVVGCAVGVGLLVATCGPILLAAEALERRRLRRALRPHFGPYWRRGREAAWRHATDGLVPGARLLGAVVAASEARSELYLDVARGFPATLALFRVRAPAEVRVGDVTVPPGEGEVVAARVLRVDALRREIVLTQEPRDLLLDSCGAGTSRDGGPSR